MWIPLEGYYMKNERKMEGGEGDEGEREKGGKWERKEKKY